MHRHVYKQATERERKSYDADAGRMQFQANVDTLETWGHLFENQYCFQKMDFIPDAPKNPNKDMDRYNQSENPHFWK